MEILTFNTRFKETQKQYNINYKDNYMENKEEELNNLRIENEIKKMKLSMEYGASFFSPFETKLSPEQEAQWLDHVQQFEDAYGKSKRILIYDFLGNPAYKPVVEIPECDIKSELKGIINLLNEKGIGLDTICKVDDRELYRFITEELFIEETDDMMIEGMMCNFIYEEFHPNHEHDIKNCCKEFADKLLNKMLLLNSSFMAMSDEIYSKEGIIKLEDAIKKLEAFREAFSSFKLQHYQVITLEIDEEKAVACVDLKYSGVLENSNDTKTFSGVGSFNLKCEYDYWCINRIDLPGISI